MNNFIASLSGTVAVVMVFAIHRIFTDVPMDKFGLWLYAGGIGAFVFFVVYKLLNGSDD